MSTPFPSVVQKSDISPEEAYSFFKRIQDVEEVQPTGENEVLWECRRTDIEMIVGLAIVNTATNSVFVNLIAVDESYRRCDVATAILDTIASEYNSLRCRVHQENTESQQLMESFGFTRSDIGRYPKLVEYKY